MTKEQQMQFDQAMGSMAADAVLLQQIRRLLANARLRAKRVHNCDDALVRATVARDAVSYMVAQEALNLDEVAEQCPELLKGGKYGA